MFKEGEKEQFKLDTNLKCKENNSSNSQKKICILDNLVDAISIDKNSIEVEIKAKQEEE